MCTSRIPVLRTVLDGGKEFAASTVRDRVLRRIRMRYFLAVFISNSIAVFAQDAVQPVQSHNKTARQHVTDAAESYAYPSYENGTDVPLSERALQALNVGSTFQLQRKTGN